MHRRVAEGLDPVAPRARALSRLRNEPSCRVKVPPGAACRAASAVRGAAVRTGGLADGGGVSTAAGCSAATSSRPRLSPAVSANPVLSAGWRPPGTRVAACWPASGCLSPPQPAVASSRAAPRSRTSAERPPERIVSVLCHHPPHHVDHHDLPLGTGMNAAEDIVSPCTQPGKDGPARNGETDGRPFAPTSTWTTPPPASPSRRRWPRPWRPTWPSARSTPAVRASTWPCEAAAWIDELRARLDRFFNNPARDPNRAVFTANATDALNLAIARPLPARRPRGQPP